MQQASTETVQQVQYSADASGSRAVLAPSQKATTTGNIIAFPGISMAAPKVTTEDEPMPSVEVATIGKVASGVVFMFCMASYLIGIATGFYAIFPPMSLLGAGMAALMYVLSVMLAKQWGR